MNDQELLALLEAAQIPIEVQWKKTSTEWHGTFIVKEQLFNIDITIIERCPKFNIHQFKFFRDNKTKLFNDFKHPFQVVPTVKKALEDFVREFKPDAVLFAAVADSKARAAFYKLHGGYLASKFNYLDVSRIPMLKDFPLFGIYKKEEYEHCVFDLIGLEY